MIAGLFIGSVKGCSANRCSGEKTDLVDSDAASDRVILYGTAAAIAPCLVGIPLSVISACGEDTQPSKRPSPSVTCTTERGECQQGWLPQLGIEPVHRMFWLGARLAVAAGYGRLRLFMGHVMRGCSKVVALVWLVGCGSSHTALEGPNCQTVVSNFEIAVSNTDAVDLLIVLDVSPSMAEEQATLARELPQLIRMLTTGEWPPGRVEYTPMRDLHVGIISGDLGASSDSATLTGCSELGDAAQLQHAGGGADCATRYPPFLSYFVPVPTRHPLVEPPGTAEGDALAHDVGCIAQLGSSGCAISQPLEAALRALSPDGAQAGFLRDDPARGLSALQVLLISDGDDCSISDSQLFAEAARTSAASPDALCAERSDLLQGLDRFLEGLRALRPTSPELVSFSAITGIPAGRSDAQARAGYVRDRVEREQYFADLLADPRMQPRPRADGTLEPVCQSELASATPAPRIVELARRFGSDGDVVQSICEPDWAGALTSFPARLERRLGAASCMPRRWTRSEEGLAPCRVLWELPPPEFAYTGTPVHCADQPFLSPLADPPRSERGGEVCEVRQRAISGAGDERELEPGGGWFYDDFSAPADCTCFGAPVCNTLVFVPNGPPSGVIVKLQCQETQCTEPDCDPDECRVPG